jgi:hypothetical protein
MAVACNNVIRSLYKSMGGMEVVIGLPNLRMGGMVDACKDRISQSL